MEFLNETWFWSGFFAVLGSAVGSLGTLLIKEWFGHKNQLQVERLKIYQAEILAAHKVLYLFASTMHMQFAPPDNPRLDFIAIMKRNFYDSVKPNMLLFSPAIRRILNDFEAQYHCIGDPDLIPRIPFDEFVDKHLHKNLDELEKHIEKTADSAFKQLW